MSMTLEDIFASDEYGLLDIKVKRKRTDEDRLIDAFEEVNNFINRYGREPTKTKGGMWEYNLASRLEVLRSNEDFRRTLQPYDRHRILKIQMGSNTDMEK